MMGGQQSARLERRWEVGRENVRDHRAGDHHLKNAECKGEFRVAVKGRLMEWTKRIGALR